MRCSSAGVGLRRGHYQSFLPLEVARSLLVTAHHMNASF